MLLPHQMAAYLAIISMITAIAASEDLFSSPNFKFYAKRQGDAYQSTTTQCGSGATCEASCGAGYIICGSQAEFFCYNPSIKEICCAPDSGHSWACSASNFCLVDGYCCANGDDPTTCAQANSVALPANFSSTPPTSSAAGYVMSSFGASVATPYSIVTTSTTESSSSPPQPTASPHTKTNSTSGHTSHASSASHKTSTKGVPTTSSTTLKATGTALKTVPLSSGTLNGTYFTPTASAASTSIAAFSGAAKANFDISVKGLMWMIAGIGAGASLV